MLYLTALSNFKSKKFLSHVQLISAENFLSSFAFQENITQWQIFHATSKLDICTKRLLNGSSWKIEGTLTHAWYSLRECHASQTNNEKMLRRFLIFETVLSHLHIRDSAWSTLFISAPHCNITPHCDFLE